MELSIIAKNIRLFYDKRLHNLPVGKQFHYLSRLSFWTGMKKYGRQIVKMKTSYFKEKKEFILYLSERKLLKKKEIIQKIEETNFFGGESRKLAKKKYYRITQITPIISLIRQYKQFYGVDYTSLFEKEYDIAIYLKVIDNILNDSRSFLHLSTSAVNFIYGMQNLTKKRLIRPRTIYDLIQTELQLPSKNLDNNTVGSVIYIITHAIIGETSFYEKKITSYKTGYKGLLKLGENLLAKYFTGIKLDIKLEFQLCCRICGYVSFLEPIINSEVKESYKVNASYLIDVYNPYKGETLSTLGGSEHRNVLFIMNNTKSKLV